MSRRDSLAFVLVARPIHNRGKRSWDIPSLSQCQDFINEFISKIYAASEEAGPWVLAYNRSGKWGKVGTVLLSTENIENLCEFRRQLALWPFQGHAFDLFPKDVLSAKADVSILLRASMKAFKTEIIPRVLFARNQESLAGALRVVSSRFYSAEEKSHKGETKEYWRSIELKGDEQFMRCLRAIPESKPLLLGFDSVQIKGGLRPQEPEIAGHKRSWPAETPTNTFPPLLIDPRTNLPIGTERRMVDENTPRGTNKRGRAARGSNRRRGRGRFPR